MNPEPGLIILSPAGYVMRIQQSLAVNGTGTYGAVIVAPVLNGAGVAVLSGVGEHPLTLSGVRGTLEVQLTTGVLGSSHTVVALVDRPASPTTYISISLDASNRPYVVVKDAAGTTVGRTAVSGTSIPAGTRLHLVLVWDSQQPLDSDSHVYFEVNGSAPNVWYTEAHAPWVPFVPWGALLGYGPDGEFNGTLDIAQVTDTAKAVPAGTTAPRVEQVSFVANSSVTAAMVVTRGIDSSMLADSTVGADLTVDTPPP